MHISWLGLSAFKFETKDTVIVTDPYAPQVAPRPLRAKADILTVSNPASDQHGHVDAVLGSPFLMNHPGEFEVKGVYIEGMEAPPSTLFTFDMEGVRLAHLGDIRSAPSDELLEKIDGVDILFLPVGGNGTLEPESAMRVVNAIEPRMVVPMHFAQEGWKTKAKLLPVAAFLREIGASKVEPVERLTIKKRDIGEEETKVVVFSSER